MEILLAEWQESNSQKNVRGILLYSEGHFFQVLEGEKENVLSLFNSIEKDSRHTGIIQVFGKEVSQGSFDGYKVKNLKGSNYSKPYLISQYCESVKGMDSEVQQQIKIILKSFVDTQVL